MAEMNLQMRIDLMARLGQYILSGASEWQEEKQKASLVNPWFTGEFIDIATKNIANHFLDNEKLVNWIASYTDEHHQPGYQAPFLSRHHQAQQQRSGSCE